MELGLKGKIVMVTGAGSGIGAALAQSFCKQGCKTIFVDINERGLSAASSSHRDLSIIKKCDVSSIESVHNLFAEIDRDYGMLHVLINCAAINSASWIEDINEKEFQKIIDVNIKGYVYTTKYAVPLMRKAGYGRLIYINSNSGLKASAGLALYSGSKYFDRGFSISVALEVGKYGITANSICPSDVYPEGEIEPKSWTNRDLIRISLEKEGVSTFNELKEKRRKANPMRRNCTTNDICDLALFLASERASFINGQSIAVNGGSIPY